MNKEQMDEADYIIDHVSDAMAWSMDTFNFHDIIDATERLTPEQKAWAKEHLSWKVYLVEE